MLPFIIGGAAILGATVFSVKAYISMEEERKREEQRRERQEREEEERWIKEAEKRRQEEEKRIFDSGICQVDKMSGREFEELLSLCFRKIGYLVTITSYSQDYGADLILYRGDAKFVVQAKRSQKPVGIRAVQEVVSAIKHYKAHKGMVITNNTFTDNAHQLALSNDVDLINREKLIRLMISAKRGY